MKDQLTVGELRKSLEGVPDDVIVGIDTEGGAFTSHINSSQGGSYEDEKGEMGVGPIFVISCWPHVRNWVDVRSFNKVSRRIKTLSTLLEKISKKDEEILIDYNYREAEDAPFVTAKQLSWKLKASCLAKKILKSILL